MGQKTQPTVSKDWRKSVRT